MVNPDEESQHAGIISAVSELNRLKKEKIFRIQQRLIPTLLHLFTMEIPRAIFIQEPLGSCFHVFIFTEGKCM